MKKSMFLSVALVAALGSYAGGEPSFGPRVNRDDQYRFFWFVNPKHFFPLGLDMGLNLVYDPFSSRWFEQMPKDARDAETARRRALFERYDRSGVDVIEFVTAEGRLNLKDHPEFQKVGPDGKRKPGEADNFSPALRAFLRDRWTRAAEAIRGLRAVVGINALSEPAFGSASGSAEYTNACIKALGFPPPSDAWISEMKRTGLPLSRVVSKDFVPYAYLHWWWRGGNGWNPYVEDCAKTYREVLGWDIPCGYDPITRCPPLWGSGAARLQFANQWYYAQPEPYGSSFMASEEQAMARGTPGMQVFTMLQAMLYRSVPIPKDAKPTSVPAWIRERPNANYITMPPDLMREALWTLFSRKIAGMGFHGGNAMFDEAAIVPESEREKVRLGRGYNFTNPELRLAVRDAFHRAGIPLGPLFKAIPERAPAVAMLESGSSVLLAGTGCGYGWGSAIGDMLVAANVPPYVLYEQEIERDGIPPSVKVIVASGCSVMLDTTYRALVAFQERGGIIFADDAFVPSLLADAQLPGGFPRYRQECSVEDRDNMKKVVPGFKRALAPYVKPYADSENGDLVVSARTYRNADYVFAVNDRRTFGDYVGPWGRVPEKGLPNAGVVTVARADAKAVYNLVEHRSVPFRVKGGRTEIDVSYATTDGRIFLVSPRPLAALTIRREGDAVVVASSDRDVMIPIEVAVDGKNPRYGVVEDGVWRRTYAPGRRLRVTNLADGKTVFADEPSCAPSLRPLKPTVVFADAGCAVAEALADGSALGIRTTVLPPDDASLEKALAQKEHLFIFHVTGTAHPYEKWIKRVRAADPRAQIAFIYEGGGLDAVRRIAGVNSVHAFDCHDGLIEPGGLARHLRAYVKHVAKGEGGVDYDLLEDSPELKRRKARTQRLHDSKWGVFNHYLGNARLTAEEWNRRVDSFDVKRLGDQLESCGAGFYIITVMQGFRWMCAPNDNFDRIGNVAPGEACSRRDLPMELADELAKRHIDLYLYYTGDGPYKDDAVGPLFGFTRARYFSISERFVRNWASVLEEFSLRYGEKVRGWWIDGCYDEKFFGYTQEMMDLLAAAAWKGNPKALVAMNNGVTPYYARHYRNEDFTCGEFNDFYCVPESRFIDGAQAFALIPLGAVEHPQDAGWGRPGCRRNPRDVANYVKLVNDRDGVVAIDVAVAPDGSWRPEQIEALKTVGRTTGTLKE